MTNQGTDKRFLEIEMIYEEGDIRGVLDIVMNVFFRYRMGERYFKFKSLWGGFLVVLAVRFSFLLGENFNSGYPFHALDIVLVLYVLLGAWHLIQHFRLGTKGQNVHTYFMGYSRLFFIGRGFFWVLNILISLPFRLFKTDPPKFGARSAFYFTYTIVEPLVTLGLAALFYFYLKANFAALLLVVAALILFWTALNKVSSARQIYVDKNDGEIFSESIKTDMVKANDKQMKRQGMRIKTPPSYSPSLPVKPVPPSQPSSHKHKPMNVMDDLRKINPLFKNLDKEDGTE